MLQDETLVRMYNTIDLFLLDFLCTSQKESEPEELPAAAAAAVVPGIWDAVRKGDTDDVLAQLASGASIDEADSEGERGEGGGGGG